MSIALTRHDTILEERIREAGGEIVKRAGDGMIAVFDEGEPLQCALDIQRQISCEVWEGIDELRLRIALNTGEAEQREGEYVGPVLNRALGGNRHGLGRADSPYL